VAELVSLRQSANPAVVKGQSLVVEASFGFALDVGRGGVNVLLAGVWRSFTGVQYRAAHSSRSYH